VDFLAESVIRITVLAIAVALVLRTLRIRSPRLAHRAWSAVVILMLLQPVLVIWGPEFAVPLLPAGAASGIALPAGSAAAVESTGISTAVSTLAHSSRMRITWASVVFAVYGVGVALFLVRLAVGLRRASAIRSGVVLVHGRWTHPACVTPMTIGIFSPVVILPSDWPGWSEAELSAVLAHEEEHVRRRDPLVAGLALVNRAVFWFHPLAWWLQRKISGLSEQACDALVISRGHDIDVYSDCLLRFARRIAHAGGRIAATAMAMPGEGLRERLGLLAHHVPAPPSRRRLACAAVATVAAAVVCTAAMPAAVPMQNASLQAPRQAAWPVETSEHFQISHDNLPADEVSQAAREIEVAYAHVSAALRHEMPSPVRVVLVQRDRDVADGEAAQSATPTREQRIVISLESLDRRPGIFVHELAHRFAFEIIPETSRIAPVLAEGLAEHLRGAWRTDDWQMTRTAAVAGAIPTVASLVNTDRHWAHAVFEFVAAKYGDDGVRRLLFALRGQHTLAPAVPVAFGITFDQFDEEFRGYVTSTFGQP